MKRFRITGVCLLLVFLAAGNAEAQHDPATLTQAVDKFGVHVEYPAGWTAVASDVQVNGGAILIFPEAHPPSGEWISHGFSVESFPSPKYTMEDYKLVLSGDIKRIAHTMNEGGGGTATIVAEQPTKIAGVDGYAISYELNPPLKLMMTARKETGLLVVPKPKQGETARCLHLFAPENEWQNYQPVLFAMLDSVRLQQGANVGQQRSEQKTESKKMATVDPGMAKPLATQAVYVEPSQNLLRQRGISKRCGNK